MEKLQLKVERRVIGSNYTAGKLFAKINSEFVPVCDTLEDKLREIKPDGRGKIHGSTAIPAGTYEVRLTRSNRFQRVLPELINVPHFSGVRIHTGNSIADTEGCILVGHLEGNTLYGGTSRPAMVKLMEILDRAVLAGKSISIEIVNPTK